MKHGRQIRKVGNIWYGAYAFGVYAIEEAGDRIFTIRKMHGRYGNWYLFVGPAPGNVDAQDAIASSTKIHALKSWAMRAQKDPIAPGGWSLWLLDQQARDRFMRRACLDRFDRRTMTEDRVQTSVPVDRW